ncbi:MAG TPA: amidohydrolase family protein [Gemmatimonadaceae bacterium]
MIRYHARWVLPVARPALRDATVAVEGRHITWVGPRADAPPGDDDVDLGEAILMPGLVNSHTHLELTAMRGFLEDLDFSDWILRLAAAKRRVLSRDDLLDAARLGIVEGLHAGITTYADTCDSGVAFDAMLEAGVRGVMYQEVFGPDPAQCEPSLAELRAKVAALRPRESALVRAGISPHAPYTVSDALFAACATLARDERLPMAVHVAEGVHESELVERAGGIFAEGLRKRGVAVAPRGRSPIELLERTGVLGVAPLLIHCVRVGDADIARMRAAGAAVAHCPASNARLGHGIAPLREMLDAGLRVGLGSDSVASNNRMDLLEEARLAALFQGARTRRAHALPAGEAIALATLGGARALGLDDRIGTLEPGKEADLAAFALDRPHAVPVQEPEAAALHALRGTDAAFVAVAGEVRVRDRVLLGGDPALPARVQDAADRMAAWLEAVRARGGVVPPRSATR